MQIVEFFEVHQKTDEQNSKVLGCFSDEVLANIIAAENPGWYNAQSWVSKRQIVIHDSIWEWIGQSA